MSGRSDSGSGCGCISAIAAILFVIALVSGVTIGGKHYGLNGCSCDRGLIIDH